MKKRKKPSKMPPAASEEELAVVGDRWNGHRIPDGAAQSIYEVGRKILQRLMQIWDLSAFTALLDENTGETLGRDLSKVCIPSLVLCYHIGYDIASGQLPRSEGQRYLLAATGPIGATIKGMLQTLFEGALIDTEKSLEHGAQMAVLVVNCANEACSLGIEDYHRAKSR